MTDELSPDSHRKAHAELSEKLDALDRRLECGISRLNEAVEGVEKVYDTLRHMTEAVQRTNDRADEVAQAAHEMAELLWYERGCNEQLRRTLDRYKMLVDESPEARAERQDRETPPRGVPKP